MENKYRYLLKNTGILTISNFSSKILVFLLIPLYTNILTTEEYGTYDLIASTIQLLVPILTINITDGVFRYLMDETVDSREVISIGTKYVIIGILIFIIFAVINFTLNLWPVLNRYIIYVGVYFTSSVFYQLLNQISKGQGKIKELGAAGVISTIVTILMNIVFLVIIPLGIEGFLSAYILGQVVPAIYLALVTRYPRALDPKINRNLEKEMRVYSIPLIMTSIGWWMNSVSDRYVITWVCGLAENGIYSIAYKIPTIITVFQGIFIQAWTVSAIKEYGQQNQGEFYKRTFFYLNGLMVVGCSVLMLFAKEIAEILYAKEFYNAWVYVPFLLVSCIFNAASAYIGPILAAEKKSKIMASAALYGAIINFSMNILLVYWIGSQGAAIATAIASFIIYYKRRRAVNEMVKSDEDKKINISWILIILQAILMIEDLLVHVQFAITISILFIFKSIVVDGLKKIRK